MRTGWWAASALVVTLVSIAVASDDDGAVAMFRSRVVDLSSDAEVARLRDDLLARGHGAFSEGVFTSQSYAPSRGHGGRLRSLLAASLSDEHVVAELRAAQDDAIDPADRLEALLVNLRGRRGLGSASLAEGVHRVAVAVVDGERPQKLIDALASVARDELLDGDDALATALLSQPTIARRTAEHLADGDHYPAGLCFVADVLTREGVAREALVGFDVNLGDMRVERPLGTERRARLVRVAREDPDPALRVVAAHVLHFANTYEGAAAAYEAKEHARSHRIWLDEWNWLGRTALPPLDLPLRPAFRARAAGAWMYLSHVSADESPNDAESMAAELRAYYHGVSGDRAKGALVRTLEQLEYRFVDTSRVGRPRIVPSFAKLLDEWKRGSEGAGPSLRALEQHVARRLEVVMLRGEPADRRGTFVGDESPVVSLLPEHAPDDDERAASVARWIAADPAHLHDTRVRHRLAAWGQDALSSLLAAYPEDVLRTMLTTPPTREVRVGPKSQPRHDPSGSLARQPLVEFLAADPRHAARLSDAELWRTWPESDRRHAGAQLHRLLQAAQSPLDASILADDAFALGFVEDAFGDESGPLPGDPALALAARVIAGIDARPELRARLADGDAGDDDITFLNGLSLDAATFAGLVEVLKRDADPRAAMVAARLLAATGRGDALDQVFAADAWLACGTVFSTSTWSDDVAYLVHDDETRDAVLRYVAAPGGLPSERVSAFEELADLEWVDAIVGEDAPADAEVARLEREIEILGSWLQAGLASLDPDVAEGVATAWLTLPVERLPDGRDQAAERWLGHLLGKALENFPDSGSKRRMLAELASYRDAE